MHRNEAQEIDLQELAQFLSDSERLLVISGAGISTASGIGDYRDERGEWKRPQPVQHQDFMGQLSWRRRYWARSMIGFPEFMRAEPNAAHRVLARWEDQGRLAGVITQNVDRLHQRAGQEAVLDLHGRLDQVVCMSCGEVSSRAALQAWLERQNPELGGVAFNVAPDGDADLARSDFTDICVPDCQTCGGVLKPNVVFYGDSVPRDIVDQAYAWVEAADAVLVLGSSLMVFSSFRFVRHAHQRGIPIAAINRGKMRGEELLDCKLAEDVGTALSALETHLARA